MAVEVVDDALALPVLDPMIPRHQAVVFVHLPVPLAPVVKLPPSQPAPLNDLLHRHTRLRGDRVDEIDNLVTTVMCNPAATQASPSFFVIVYRSGLTKGTGVLSGARRIDVTMSITRIPL